MNWDIFWLVLICIPLAAIAFAAGEAWADWIRDRYGSAALYWSALVQLLIFAVAAAWAFA